ncbi:nucleotide sugar dehydrogenase [Bosea sp. SSUT16]|jgi:UDP-N-acetyl-D-glucosamine dehydrogenase|uniref:Nucleotide sugar dehydrogenase n=1 Tax=Bosea spartocytisi TaxID=2773451 RepID=A0A927HYE8_9HYPH|nr:nucleotide sugar dehydrogenase [Bosea spartocytisi]MBD3845144.1 nucleotide sugar dehydrogenase [Bosea spartocytisi]MCT4472313.1 nucleotide sugar dehydrogenase [Bosea spartocytisi]
MSASAPPRSVTDSGLSDQLARIAGKDYRIGIIGLGYVGLPLAMTACKAGFKVLGFDIDAKRVMQINRGESFIKHIPTEAINAAIKDERFRATTDFDELRDVDAIVIAVPTPLTKHREPDLSYVEATARAIAPRLRKGHLVVLESTTWPGTTDEVMRPIFEATGLKSGVDFYLAFSPEREDPGNLDFDTSTIPKVVGGDGADALALANAVYSALVVKTVPVSSPRTAEAVKLTENIFRAVNIALVNELKVVYSKMGIDVWEVIDAAKTKPFGFMPFYPGPGLGGHCIPIDPFYLTWKAREFDVTARFIELAGQINTAMPHWVVDRVAEALDRRQGRGLSSARILVVGIAYKKNIEDTRESPALKLIELLEERGATADYHDPYVPELPRTRKHGNLAGRASVPLTADIVASYDAVLIATDHDAIDYRALAEAARLVVDTRNACAKAGLGGDNIVKA